jgi:hypothetical protein
LKKRFHRGSARISLLRPGRVAEAKAGRYMWSMLATLRTATVGLMLPTRTAMLQLPAMARCSTIAGSATTTSIAERREQSELQRRICSCTQLLALLLPDRGTL